MNSVYMPTQYGASASRKPQYLFRNRENTMMSVKYDSPSKNWMKFVSQKFLPHSRSTPNSEKYLTMKFCLVSLMIYFGWYQYQARTAPLLALVASLR